MTQPSRPFDATFTSDCAGCGVEIEAGDEIVMWQGEAYHNDEDCCPAVKRAGSQRLEDSWE